MTTIRRIRPLPLALIALAAICAALVLIPWVVQAQTPSVLTSNTGLTDSGRKTMSNGNSYSQMFHTGTDTNGYTLTSIGIDFNEIANTSTAGADVRVSIHPRVSEGPQVGLPGTAVCTLDDPATFTASGVQTFTVPTSCPNLTANSQYYLIVSRTSGTSRIRLQETAVVDRAHSGWAVINHVVTFAATDISYTGGGRNAFGAAASSAQYMIEISGHRVGGI